jgi:signal transduction histidine kinase
VWFRAEVDTLAVTSEHPSTRMGRPSAVKRARRTDLVVRTDAGRLAGHRVAFYGHTLVWGMVGLLLLVTAGLYVAVVVGLAWGVALSCHGFFAVLAPRLRRRWTAEELSEQIEVRVVGERRRSEGRHARSLEELSASIAHEIRNPITAAKSLVQQLRDDPHSTDNAEYARIALEELDRVERAVSHLLQYAREEEMQLATVDFADVIGSALDGIADRISRSPARVERDLDFDVTLRADPDKLRRVVMNLVGNALDALEESSSADPVVRISCGRSLAGTEVWLRVKDNGPGIEPARLAKIWSPFHTSKKSGTGLGLAITKKIVEAHGGTIEVKSEMAVGTELVATFPSSEETP